ncbi:Protein-lysine N-methyltransferase efm5 [Friedmanniomyces endolithicus]|nr:Protein-lysine N-methyltransferase efm5 [Friedmanniomyces endolithicus]KAK0972849.1 Protein-lysine N-methyltransferase efm5 [Friedmanniomyces endolithicus]
MAPMTKSLNKVLCWPVESQDAVEREYLDQIDKNAQTFKDLDVKPADIANFTFQYLQHYRSSAYYDLPPMTEREKREGWSIPAKVCVGVVKQTFSGLSSGVEFLQLIQAGTFLGAHPKEVTNSPNFSAILGKIPGVPCKAPFLESAAPTPRTAATPR